MKKTKTIIIIKAKTLLSLFVIAPILILTLSACEQESNRNALSVSDDTLSAPIPHAILTATTDNLDIAVRIDGESPQTCANLIVDESDGTYTCNLTVPQGSHTMSLDYSINDTARGLVPVALTSTININVATKQVTTVQISTFNITYIDIDNDGIRNLDELIYGSDPFDFSHPAFRVLNFSDTGQSIDSTTNLSIDLGDIDGDGDLDIVTAHFDTGANQSGGGNSVHTNNGNGVFTDTGQSLGSTDTLCVALGDVDGDGDLDMVVANTNDANRVYTNNGSGVYTDSGQTLGPLNGSNSVALGDVDGDGDLDLVVAHPLFVANRVYTNDGDGVYTDTGQTLGTNSDSHSIALGDVDGDGDLDMVVANLGRDTGEANHVYTNNGNGIYTDTGQSLGSSKSRSVALGDVDGDGDLDMVIANHTANFQNEANRVYTNNGDGIYTDSGQSLGSNASHTVALGDVDGDGDLDMVVANSSGDGNRIYANNGIGVYIDTSQSLNLGQVSIDLGDIDGDGDMDLVIGNEVFLND